MRPPTSHKVLAALLLAPTLALARVTAPGVNDRDAFCAGGAGVESCIDQNGSVIPTTDDTHTLGTTALRFNKLNLGTNGIKFGDNSVQLTAAGSGVWGVNGSTIYYTGGAVAVGIATVATTFGVDGTSSFGVGAAKSTITVLGSIFLANNAIINMDGSGGYLNSVSSVTASSFFGDGSHLTGISGSISGGTVGTIPKYASASTFGSSFLTESASSDTFSQSLRIVGSIAAGAAISGTSITGSSGTITGNMAVVGVSIFGETTRVRTVQQELACSGGTIATIDSCSAVVTTGGASKFAGTHYTDNATWDAFFAVNKSSMSLWAPNLGAASLTMTSSGNNGFGTTSPTSALSVYGVITSSSVTPTVSCNSGSPTMGANSSDNHGSFVSGSGATQCTVTFGTGFPTAPDCFCQDDSAFNVCRQVSSVTGSVVFGEVNFSADTIRYFCFGAP